MYDFTVNGNSDPYTPIRFRFLFALLCGTMRTSRPHLTRYLRAFSRRDLMRTQGSGGQLLPLRSHGFREPDSHQGTDLVRCLRAGRFDGAALHGEFEFELEIFLSSFAFTRFIECKLTLQTCGCQHLYILFTFIVDFCATLGILVFCSRPV